MVFRRRSIDDRAGPARRRRPHRRPAGLPRRRWTTRCAPGPSSATSSPGSATARCRTACASSARASTPACSAVWRTASQAADIDRVAATLDTGARHRRAEAGPPDGRGRRGRRRPAGPVRVDPAPAEQPRRAARPAPRAGGPARHRRRQGRRAGAHVAGCRPAPRSPAWRPTSTRSWSSSTPSARRRASSADPDRRRDPARSGRSALTGRSGASGRRRPGSRTARRTGRRGRAARRGGRPRRPGRRRARR